MSQYVILLISVGIEGVQFLNFNLIRLSLITDVSRENQILHNSVFSAKIWRSGA